jgi:hypothetical protein
MNSGQVIGGLFDGGDGGRLEVDGNFAIERDYPARPVAHMDEGSERIKIVAELVSDGLAIIISRVGDPEGGLVDQAQQFDRIVEDAAFDEVVWDASDLHLAVFPFKNGGVVVIGQMCGGYFEEDEFGFVVLVAVDPDGQLAGGLQAQIVAQEAVSGEVK